MKRFFHRYLPWLNLPSGVLVALLQRTPVVRVVVGGGEALLASPVASILRSAVAAAATLGAYDALAGATTWSLVTSNNANPATFAKGSAITTVAFTIGTTGGAAPQAISSWALNGTLPPGLTFGSTSFGLTTTGTINVTVPVLLGTPTQTGTYAVTLQAFEGINATQLATNALTYTINVTGTTGTAPAFSQQPTSVTVASGSSVVFSAVASGAPTYQWSRGTAQIAGATSPTLLINGATAANAGTYTCMATNTSGSATSSAATLTIVSTTNVGRLTNISTRASVGTGANILIAGFVVGGAGTSGTEPVLIRGTGPALAALGVSGTLPDPKLTLFGAAGAQIDQNIGWNANPAIVSADAAVGAFALTPGFKDSALVEGLLPIAGGYSAQIAGASGDSGVALAEIYDATPAASYTLASPRLINISSRAVVGTGSNIIIAGIVVGGSTAKTVLIRASGPALAQFGIAGYLPDPQLTLFNSASTQIAANTGWGGNAQIVTTAASVGAFAWNASSVDSALLVTLPPGNYTAQVAGASGDTGVALIEVYDVP